MQQSLGRTFPVGLPGTNRDQLADERQGGLRQLQFGAQLLANAQVDPRDVALARPQAAEFGVNIVGLLAQVLLLTAQLYQAVLDIDLSLLHARTRFSNLPPAHGEMLGGVHGLQLGLGQQPAETPGTRLPLRRRGLGRGDHALELGDPVPAVPGSLQVEAGFLVPQLGQPGVYWLRAASSPARSVSRS